MRKLGLNIILLALLCSCSKQSVPKNGTLAYSQGNGAQADGTISGGGGIGIRCHGRLEMLDLFEARKAGLTMVATPASEADALGLLAGRFADHFWNVETIPKAEQARIISKDILAPIFEGRPFQNYGTGKAETVEFVDSLPLSNDLGNYTLPDGCQLEQIAFFSDANTHLSIVKSASKDLDWLSWDVLAAHELMYLLDRREGLNGLRPKSSPQTSESTRKFVGKLLSVDSLPTMANEMPTPDQLNICRSSDSSQDTSKNTYFYAFSKLGTVNLSLVFNQILGRQALYQMRADFKNATVDLLMNLQDGEVSETAPLLLVGLSSKSDFAVKLTKQKGGKPLFELTFLGQQQSQPIGPIQGMDCQKFR